MNIKKDRLNIIDLKDNTIDSNLLLDYKNKEDISLDFQDQKYKGQISQVSNSIDVFEIYNLFSTKDINNKRQKEQLIILAGHINNSLSITIIPNSRANKQYISIEATLNIDQKPNSIE